MKLSIIMPLFNVEKTLSIALDSILMQDVDFTYEIICINDKSTDSTLAILEKYAAKKPNLKIINNEQNLGNGPSFVKGISAAKGDYFAVLDGDDFYTVKNKLQKQIDFLDCDKKEAYSAVCHKHLTLFDEKYIVKNEALFGQERDYSYKGFLKNNFYSHTATYVYRNFLKDKIPQIFHEIRGDHIRTFVTLNYTQGRVKQLNFVGSVYRFNRSGIWSKLSRQEQYERMINFKNKCIDFATTNLEKNLIKSTIKNTVNNTDYKTWTISECFEFIEKLAHHYGFSDKDFIFQRSYKSEFLDSFAESLGRIELNSRGLSPLSTVNSNANIAISATNLTPTGEGVYREILDLIEVNSDKNVFLILADVDSEDNLHSKVKEDFSQFNNLTVCFCKEQGESKLKYLFDILLSNNVSKVYHYCGHTFPYASALIQQGIYENIFIFSIDRGFAHGIDNSSIDCYIAKNITNYELLKKEYSDKVIYIPEFSKEVEVNGEYAPFKNHNFLITATAAASFDKFNSLEMDYANVVVKILQTTKGKHYHYGPINDDMITKIYSLLDDNNIPSNSFIHINWATNFCQEMLDNNVDLFISSFPVGSAKITLNVCSAGIPIICYRGEMRIHCNAFVHPHALFWHSLDDFFKQLEGISPERLTFLSNAGKKYFQKNNSLDVVSGYVKNEKHFEPLPPSVYFRDRNIIEVYNVRELLCLDTVRDIYKLLFPD